tara:strand:+ start:56 stop:460 length:405 start_codon:yes stop_codon:yes gene_type:complete
MKILLILFFLLFSPSVFSSDFLKDKKFLCSRVLWGFEFISSDKVNVISTDINNITTVSEYYYEIDFELSYVNLYLNKKNRENIVFSIHDKTFRVDVWTMTSGGNTTREIIPAGFCKNIKINDIVAHIEELKNLN